MTGDLIERIAERAKELGGQTAGSNGVIVEVYFASGLAKWYASVPVKPPGKRNRYAKATGASMDQTVRALAQKVGAL